jgi:hypothetical protein
MSTEPCDLPPVFLLAPILPLPFTRDLLPDPHLPLLSRSKQQLPLLAFSVLLSCLGSGSREGEEVEVMEAFGVGESGDELHIDREEVEGGLREDGEVGSGGGEADDLALCNVQWTNERTQTNRSKTRNEDISTQCL